MSSMCGIRSLSLPPLSFVPSIEWNRGGPRSLYIKQLKTSGILNRNSEHLWKDP